MMELLRIISVVILVVQLSGTRGDLPLLPGNRLRTGNDVEIPGASLIQCVDGPMILSDFYAKQILTPTEALITARNFERYPFTSHTVNPGTLINGGIGRFSFVKLTHGLLHKRTAFALETSPEGEYAYWLPQGGYVDVPRHPTANEPHFVFTPDFSGCAWTSTRLLTNGKLRLRHVEGGHENDQFNNLPTLEKGGGVSHGMQFRDYGYVQKHGRLIKHVTAYAYMHYGNGRWTLHLQHQTCAPRPGNFALDNRGHISSMKMNYFNQKSWDPITGKDYWMIPL